MTRARGEPAIEGSSRVPNDVIDNAGAGCWVQPAPDPLVVAQAVPRTRQLAALW